MKIVMSLLVRDEEDIIRSNLEYHLASGVDFFVVTDNLSVDGTKEILMEYADRGLVHYIAEEDDTYAQSKWVTRMARLASEDFAADWILNSDADEFWWPERHSGLKGALHEVPSSVVGISVNRHNFVALAAPGPNFVSSMKYRETHSVNAIGEALPPKVCHRAALDVRVAQGNHSISIGGAVPHLPVWDGLCIFHYPLRTPAQFTRKITSGGAAYARNRNLGRTVGSAWRKLYEIQQQSGLGDYFGRAILDDRQIADAQATGSIVEDTRLSDFFARHDLLR
jgi:hypothetical protein